MNSDKININNQKEINYNLIEYNKKNYKMSLLFIQTKELKRFYNSKMENSFKKYYLVDKLWLDQYKNKNDYKSADMFDTFNDWSNYTDFKDVMGDSFLVDDDYFTRLYTSVKLKTNKYKKEIVYPTNIELVCEDYFIDCFKGSVICPMCNILIGNKSIIVIDQENKKKNKDIVVYLCSKIGKEEDYNFLIKVNFIIVFDNLENMNDELKEICLSEGINNYLSKRNLEINSSEEQSIFNSKNEKIGKFMVVYEETPELSEIEIKNPIFNLNKNNEKNDNNQKSYTKIILNNQSINKNNVLFSNNQNTNNNNFILNNQNINNNNNIFKDNHEHDNVNYELNSFSNINLGNKFQNNNNNNQNNFINNIQNNQKMIISSPNLNNNIFNLNNNNLNNNNNFQNNLNKNINNNNINPYNNNYNMNNFSPNTCNNNSNFFQNNYYNMNNYNPNTCNNNSNFFQNNNYNMNKIYNNKCNNYKINNNYNMNNNINNNFKYNNMNYPNFNNNMNNNNFKFNNINNSNFNMNDNIIFNNMNDNNYNNNNFNYNFNNNMNFSNNNIILNNNNKNNYQNINNNNFIKSYNNLSDNKVNEENEKEFNLHFKYKKKEIVLYIKPNMNFSEIKNELLENYESFKNIKIKGFLYDNHIINPESTCEQLNIKSQSKIIIIEE